LPSIVTVPAVGSSSPATIRRVVDLPQPGGPDEHHQLARREGQIEPLDRGAPGLGAVVALADASQPDFAHGLVLLATARPGRDPVDLAWLGAAVGPAVARSNAATLPAPAEEAETEAAAGAETGA
jgi:hypothetical protein